MAHDTPAHDPPAQHAPAQHAEEPHAEEHATPGGLDVPAIMLVGVVGVLLLLVIAIAAQAWFYDLRDSTLDEAQYSRPDAEVESYLDEQDDLLNDPRWAEDREGEAAAIPIERAMEIYIDTEIESRTP